MAVDRQFLLPPNKSRKILSAPATDQKVEEEEHFRAAQRFFLLFLFWFFTYHFALAFY